MLNSFSKQTELAVFEPFCRFILQVFTCHITVYNCHGLSNENLNTEYFVCEYESEFKVFANFWIH